MPKVSWEFTRLLLPSGTDSNKDRLLGRWFLLEMCWRPCRELAGVFFRYLSASFAATRAALADRAKSAFGDLSSRLTLDLFLKIGGEPLGCLSSKGVDSSGVKVRRGWTVSSVSPASSSAKGSSWKERILV